MKRIQSTAANRPTNYRPITWPTDSELSADERAAVERNRKELWENGVRREPMLTRMAFEFGAVETMMRGVAK